MKPLHATVHKHLHLHGHPSARDNEGRAGPDRGDYISDTEITRDRGDVHESRNLTVFIESCVVNTWRPTSTFRDFDVSPDGREIVLERVQERSDVVLVDLAPRD
jgi:hypothetical protein